ncbi:unnamed protein product [Miscanthus lutarioriparius]|uniref:HMA domain-containing protein n=1 Tax=Miscanthus lutarioriparius TaxID=422564 RepID=A0A811NXZ5_9POAL|nr:unnamed protein product [Miscanthus lutarioriparius]
MAPFPVLLHPTLLHAAREGHCSLQRRTRRGAAAADLLQTRPVVLRWRSGGPLRACRVQVQWPPTAHREEKTVVRADLIGSKCKTAILSAVATLEGIKSMDINDENCTLTVVGTVDPVAIVLELKKACLAAAIVSVEDDKPKEPEPPKEDVRGSLPVPRGMCGGLRRSLREGVRAWMLLLTMRAAELLLLHSTQACAVWLWLVLPVALVG